MSGRATRRTAPRDGRRASGLRPLERRHRRAHFREQRALLVCRAPSRFGGLAGFLGGAARVLGCGPGIFRGFPEGFRLQTVALGPPPQLFGVPPGAFAAFAGILRGLADLFRDGALLLRRFARVLPAGPLRLGLHCLSFIAGLTTFPMLGHLDLP